jgi:TPR repeat protein
MKTALCAVAVVATITAAPAQRWIIPDPGPDKGQIARDRAWAADQAAKKAQKAQEAARAAQAAREALARAAQAAREALARGAALKGKTLRLVNGQTNSIFSPDWCQFSGQVLQVHPGGIRVHGSYSGGGHGYFGDFFVANFPEEVADGESLTLDEYHFAKYVGLYKYSTAIGSFATLRKLDYGFILPEPPAPPPPPAPPAPSPEDKAAAAFKSLQDRAEKGDSHALCELGRCYLEGRGVSKDRGKGLSLLARAAAAGDEEAKGLLRQIGSAYLR